MGFQRMRALPYVHALLSSTTKTSSLTSSPSRTLPSQRRRTMLQPESLRLLHPRNIPAIHTRTSKLRNPHPRRTRLRRSGTTPLRRRNRIFRTEAQQCAARTMGGNLRRRRRPRPPRSAAREPGNGPAGNRYRPRQQRGTS